MKDFISRLIFGNGKQIEGKAVFWSMAFSMLDAVQSAIMLLAVTRLCGPETGGVFAIAYATAQLMYAVGTYSVRTFQATDTQYIYSYERYARARVVTGAGMAVASVAFCFLRSYGAAKTGVVLVACAYKLVEVAEDLDHGELQRRGRLDVAGRVGTLRIGLNDLAFFTVLAATRSVLAALTGVALVSLLVTAACHRSYKELWRKEPPETGPGTSLGEKRLLRECFPLFASGCLAMYINNAAKYAIDAHLGDVAQTYFSVIFMPVFTINLLSSVCFRPQMKRMAELWNCGETAGFRRMMVRQVGIILGLSVMVIGFGVWIGLRLLGLLYGVDLSGLVGEFVVLLVGGGLVALYNYLNTCITIMRRQRWLLALTGATAAAALLTADALVVRAGLTGACWVYLGLMLLEALGAAVFTAVFYRQGKRERGTMG